MALPKNFSNFTSSSKGRKPTPSSKKESRLSDIPTSETIPSPQKKTTNQRETGVDDAQSQSQSSQYGIDKKTGKRFKNLPGVKDKSYLKGGERAIAKRASSMGIGDLSRIIGEDEDFSKVDTFYGGLETLAETFLPHLRVPPSTEEIEELRKEKLRQKKEQDLFWEKQLENIEEEERNREQEK